MLTTNDSKVIYTGVMEKTPVNFEDRGRIVLLAQPNGELRVKRIVDEEDCSDKTTNKVSATIKPLK